MTNNKRKRGFTIVELVIVVAVIGILSAILIPTFVNLVEKSKSSATSADCINAYKLYRVDALDGYVGEEEDYDTDSKGDYVLKTVNQDMVFLSTEKNAELAKESCYHFVNKQWVKGTPNKLLSVCTSRDFNAAKYGKYYVFYEQATLTSIDLNPGTIPTLKKSMAINLVAQPNPSNSAVENPVWSSNEPTLVSVDENGLVTALAEGTATITVFDDANGNGTKDEGEITQTLTVSVTNETISASDVVSVEPPAFVAEHNANTSNLERTSNITSARLSSRLGVQGNRRASKSAYYHNGDEDGVDSYKVGYRNDFLFNFVGNLNLTGELKEVGAYALAPYTPKLYKLIGTEYVELVANNDYAEFVSNNRIHFKGAASVGTYRIRVDYGTNSGHYDFDFEVFDGWNLYPGDELAIMDNRDTYAGQFLINDVNYMGEVFPDYWAGHRVDHFGDPVESKDVNGIALHGNITITNKNLTNYFKYTEEEVNTYITNNPGDDGDYAKWVEKMKSTYKMFYGDDYNFVFNGEEALVGSLKDDLALYHRATSRGDNFVFEGNYFAIDYQNLKPIYSFSTYSNSEVDPMIGGKMADIKFESHATLFGFNSFNSFKKTDDTQRWPSWGGHETFNNVTILGNGALNNDPASAGGIYAFKAAHTELNCNNNIVSKAYGAFLLTSTYTIINEMNGSEYKYPTTNLAPFGFDVDKTQVDDSSYPLGVAHIDRCKGFDSYNVMLYTRGFDTIEISNSWYQNAGGPLFIVDENHFADYMTSYPGDKGSVRNHGTSTIDCTNVFAENFVQGTEPWFVLTGSQSFILPIKGLSSYFDTNNLLCKDDPLCENKNIVLNKDGITYLNMIGLDISNTTVKIENQTLGPVNPSAMSRKLEGHILFDGFGIDMNKFNYTPSEELAQFKTELGKDANKLHQGIVIETNSGGFIGFNSAIPFNFDGEGNLVEYVKNVSFPYDVNMTRGNMCAMYYRHNIGAEVNYFSALFGLM